MAQEGGEHQALGYPNMSFGPFMPAVELDGVVRTFGAHRAVDGVTLTLAPGELLAVVGPSGSGKSTLLRLIAGFERADAGTVRVGGREVSAPGVWVEPEDRRIGMVFQHGALFPHLDVMANVAFGAAQRARAVECLELVGLRDRAEAFPHELSGGERQRVALARALAADPEVVLLDEPFSALDAGLRERLRADVVGILRRAGMSAILVTHDQAEALSLADRVAVLRDGRVEQLGTPEDVYERPCSRWVAAFLGDAVALPATVVDGTAECELGRFAIEPGIVGPVELVVRPEMVAIVAADEGVEARIVGRSYYGRDQLLEVRLPSGRRVRSRAQARRRWRPGDAVGVRVEGPVIAVPAPHLAEEREGAIAR